MPTAHPDPIVKRLADRRRDLGIPATALALRCNWSPNQILQYESGARVPDLIRARRWAAELSMDLTVESLTRLDAAGISREKHVE